MIEYKVVSVARHLSSEVDTSYLDWKDDDHVARIKKIGGEWEEVTLELPIEDKPTIQIGNVIGNVVIEGTRYIQLRLQDPKLFGTFKVGDTASLLVLTIPPNTEGKDK